mmetsp:Transcript_88666/g.237093  ORF Transcript_88666/g.237093 Transcript_88666/m.237093 type:complete len:282 (-) Transcript_88666:2307-3152(-)
MADGCMTLGATGRMTVPVSSCGYRASRYEQAHWHSVWPSTAPARRPPPPPGFRALAHVKASPRPDALQQLFLQSLIIVVARQLQQVSTRARGRQPVLVRHVVHRELGVQFLETQQWRPRARRHKHQEIPLVLVVQLMDKLPQHLHSLGLAVVSTRIHSVAIEVLDVEPAGACSGDEKVQLCWGEGREPPLGDDGLESARKRSRHRSSLQVAPVVREQPNIPLPIFGRHRHIRLMRHEIHSSPTIIDGERKAQVLHLLSRATLEPQQVAVELLIQCRHVTDG